MRASDYGTQLLAQAQIDCAWGIRPLATTLFWPSHGVAARIAALLDRGSTAGLWRVAAYSPWQA
jgi:hypothetical protein